jgi:hypothetical protein
VHRGRITKQGSRLVRWAVVESVQILPKTTRVGTIRERVAARRGRTIGVVAAAASNCVTSSTPCVITMFVPWIAPGGRHDLVTWVSGLVGADRAGRDPHSWRGRPF